jgi:hypothetical protein
MLIMACEQPGGALVEPPCLPVGAAGECGVSAALDCGGEQYRIADLAGETFHVLPVGFGCVRVTGIFDRERKQRLGLSFGARILKLACDRQGRGEMQDRLRKSPASSFDLSEVHVCLLGERFVLQTLRDLKAPCQVRRRTIEATCVRVR